MHCAACGTGLADVPVAPAGIRGSSGLADPKVFRDQVSFCGKYVVSGLVLILLGAMVQLISQEPYDRLMREGQQVTGVVIECTSRAKTVKSSHNIAYTTTAHYLFYRFEAPVNGVLTPFEGKAEVEAEDCLFSRDLEQLLALLAAKQYDLLRGAGQPVQVIYAASDPSVFALKDKLKAPFPGFMLSGCIVGGAFLLLGLAGFADAFSLRIGKRG